MIGKLISACSLGKDWKVILCLTLFIANCGPSDPFKEELTNKYRQIMDQLPMEESVKAQVLVEWFLAIHRALASEEQNIRKAYNNQIENHQSPSGWLSVTSDEVTRTYPVPAIHLECGIDISSLSSVRLVSDGGFTFVRDDEAQEELKSQITAKFRDALQAMSADENTVDRLPAFRDQLTWRTPDLPLLRLPNLTQMEMNENNSTLWAATFVAMASGHPTPDLKFHPDSNAAKELFRRVCDFTAVQLTELLAEARQK